MHRLTCAMAVVVALGLVAPGPSQGGCKVTYEVRRAGRVSLGIYDTQGRLVRMLQSGKKRAPGQYEITWDGTDDRGQPAAPGPYTLRGVSADVGARYLLTAGTAGKPPWPTADGKGAWGALWGNVIGAHVDRDGMLYLVWFEEEGEGALVKVKPDGPTGDFVQWKQHKNWDWGKGIDVTTDGEHVFFLLGGVPRDKKLGSAFLRLRKDTGDYAYYDRNRTRIVAVGRTYERDELIPDWAVIAARVPTRRRIWTLPGEFAQPRRRLGPPAVHYLCNGRSIAAHKGRLYISLYLENRIAVHDATTGKEVASIDGVPRPQGLAVDGRGMVYVASCSEIVKINPGVGMRAPVVRRGLSAPFGVDVDADGNLYVTDLGDAMQLKVFAPGGQLMHSVGRKGGRPYGGSWAKHKGHFLYPGHPAADRQGTVYVPEDATPRRVAIVRGERVVDEWIGPLPGACNHPVAVDGRSPEMVYHLPMGNDLVRYRIDYEGKTWQIDAYWNGFTSMSLGGLKPAYPALTYARDMHVRHYRGKTFLIVTTPFCVYRVDGDDLVPCTVVGTVHDGWLVGHLLKQQGKPAPAGTQVCVWRDRNGDWELQPKEVDLRVSKALRESIRRTGAAPLAYSGFYVDAHMNLYVHDYRRQWVTPPTKDKDMGSGSLWRVPCRGLDRRGCPIYSWAHAQPLLENRTAVPTIDFARLGAQQHAGKMIRLGPQSAYRDADGNSYFVWNTMGVRDVGINWAARNTLARVGRFDKDGALRWVVGKKARSIARPGEMYVPHTVAGIEKRCVFVVDRNGQLRVFDRDTGLYVGSALRDVYVGPMPDQYTLILTIEWTTAQVFTHHTNGKTYLATGDYNGPRFYELTGLDSVERFSRPVELAKADRTPKPTGPVRPKQPDQSLHIVPAPGPVRVDGKLNEWDTSRPSGPICVDASRPDLVRTRSAMMHLMYDRLNLYIGATVRSPSALHNRARQGRGQWYFFDSIQVRVKTPGMLCHLGFYQDTPTGKHFVPRAWKGPRGYKEKTEQVPGAQLAMVKTPDGKGYVMEAAVPWAGINPAFKPAPGTRFNCGLQVNWCNASRTEVFRPSCQIGWNGGWDFHGMQWGPATLLKPRP